MIRLEPLRCETYPIEAPISSEVRESLSDILNADHTEERPVSFFLLRR